MRRESPSSALQASSRLRAEGNAAIKRGDYQEAARCYVQAIKSAPEDFASRSNLSHALLSVGRPMEAAQVATVCVQMAPHMPKGYYRLAVALMEMSAWAEAAAVIAAGLQHAPGNQEFRDLLDSCLQRMATSETTTRCQRQLVASHLSASLVGAIKADQKADLQWQLSNSLAAPGDWVPEDFEWRPVWCSEMLYPANVMNTTDSAVKDSIAATATKRIGGKPGFEGMKQLLASICVTFADLAAPSQLLSVARDEQKVNTYATAIKACMLAKPGCHVLCLGPGAILWALLAANAGASHATVICSSQLAYKAAKQVLDANQHISGWESVQMAAAPLHHCTIYKATAANDMDKVAGTASGKLGSQGADDNLATRHTQYPESALEQQPYVVHGGPAQIVITDQLDHSVLGRGLVSDIRTAAFQGLLAENVLVLPSRITVFGQLIQDGWVGCVSGFDVSPVNATQWYPGIKPKKENKIRPALPLSKPFELATLHLDAVAAQALEAESESTSQQPDVHQGEVVVCAEATGVCNAVAVSLRLNFHVSQSSDPVTLKLHDTGQLFLDPVSRTTKAQKVKFAVLIEDCAIHVRKLPPEPSTPRSLSLPSWHITQLMDETRTQLYEQGIRSAFQHQATLIKAAGKHAPVVLDVNAGCGLLSMIAARLGAEAVYALEPSASIAELAAGVLAGNASVMLTVSVVPTGLRKVAEDMLVAKASGAAKPISHVATSLGQRPADILILQNLDAGLIGEGVLTCLHIASAAGLVKADANVVPCSAKVYAQLLVRASESRHSRLPPNFNLSIDIPNNLSQCIDYSSYVAFDSHSFGTARQPSCTDGISRHAIDWRCVGSPEGCFRPATQPQAVFHFDFHQVLVRGSQPEQYAYDVTAAEDGEVCAVAFWYELQTSPGNGMQHSSTSTQGLLPSQQVAVQYLRPADSLPVTAGQTVKLFASHDTHAITFRVGAVCPEVDPLTDGGLQQTPVGSIATDLQPMEATTVGDNDLMAAWQARKAQYDVLQKVLNAECGPDPHARRAAGTAAMQLAARPHDDDVARYFHGVPAAAQAAMLAYQMAG